MTSLNDQKVLKNLQEDLAESLFENNACSNPKIVSFVENNQGDTNVYGKTFCAMPPLELPFYQFIHSIQNPIVLDIAGGNGRVAINALFALKNQKGTVYMNELSQPMIEKCKKSIETRKIPENLKQNIKFIPGNYLDIRSTHKELKGKINAIHVQNFEHFLNPKQHQELVSFINDSLAPGGRAFLAANTFVNSDMVLKTPMADLYKERKNLFQKTKLISDIYAGFVWYQSSYLQKIGSPFPLSQTYHINSVSIPKKDSLCSVTYPSVKEDEETGCISVIQETIGNRLTPQIYKDAFSTHPSLSVIDTFFVTKNMLKQTSYGINSTFAAAIVEKK